MDEVLLSSTKKILTFLPKRKKTEAQETLEFKTMKATEIFYFDTPPNLQADGKSMLAITHLKVYQSFFNLPQEVSDINISYVKKKIFSILEE